MVSRALFRNVSCFDIRIPGHVRRKISDEIYETIKLAESFSRILIPAISLIPRESELLDQLPRNFRDPPRGPNFRVVARDPRRLQKRPEKTRRRRGTRR